MSPPQKLNLPGLGAALRVPKLGRTAAVVFLGLGSGIPALVLPSPTLAHQVQVTDTVGATLHIEPNDLPRAGSPHQLWFALTQAGGQIIPLSDCDCTLTLYGSDGTAIASPPLSPISAEGYQAIPGAEVTFPTVGAYELALVGAPQGEATFEPFELSFDVTVAAGVAAPSEPAPDSDSETAATAPQAATSESPPDGVEQSPGDGEPEGEAPASSDLAAQSPWPRFALMGAGLVVLVGAAIWRSLRRNS